MKNFIEYYYNLYPNEIFSKDEYFYFFINNNKFYLKEYIRELDIIDELVKISNNLFNNGIKVNTFIKNKDNNYLTINNNKYYCVLMVNDIEEESVDIFDVIDFNNLIYSTSSSLYIDSVSSMKDRVDLFEKQVIEFNNEYNKVLNSFNYYVGLSENAISYAIYSLIGNEVNSSTYYYLSHNRLNYGLKRCSLYDPLAFVFDYKCRDIVFYLKKNFFNGIDSLEELEVLIKNNSFNELELKILYSKLLYPDYYFDIVERIIKYGEDEKLLDIVINKIDKYEEFLFNVYVIINKYVNIAKIDWLISKNN